MPTPQSYTYRKISHAAVIPFAFFSHPKKDVRNELSPSKDAIDRDNLSEESLRPYCCDFTRHEKLAFVSLILAHQHRYIDHEDMLILRDNFMRAYEGQYTFDLAYQLSYALQNKEDLPSFNIGREKKTPAQLLREIQEGEHHVLPSSRSLTLESRLHPGLYELAYYALSQHHIYDIPDTVSMGKYKTEVSKIYMRQRVPSESSLNITIKALINRYLESKALESTPLFRKKILPKANVLLEELERNEKWFKERGAKYKDYYRFLFIQYTLLNQFIESCRYVNKKSRPRTITPSDILTPLIKYRDEMLDFLLSITELRIQNLWAETKDTGSRVDLSHVFSEVIRELAKVPRFAFMNRFFKKTEWLKYQAVIANAISFLVQNDDYQKGIDFSTMLLLANHLIQDKKKSLQKATRRKMITIAVLATIVIGAITIGFAPAAGAIAAGTFTVLDVARMTLASVSITYGSIAMINAFDSTHDTSDASVELSKLTPSTGPLSSDDLPKDPFLQKIIDALNEYNLLSPREHAIISAEFDEFNMSSDNLLAYFCYHQISPAKYKDDYEEWLDEDPAEPQFFARI